ncbi:hypothetical protein JCM10213_006616 [Rhodosporidiobolus nylandii]
MAGGRGMGWAGSSSEVDVDMTASEALARELQQEEYASSGQRGGRAQDWGFAASSSDDDTVQPQAGPSAANGALPKQRKEQLPAVKKPFVPPRPLPHGAVLLPAEAAAPEEMVLSSSASDDSSVLVEDPDEDTEEDSQGNPLTKFASGAPPTLGRSLARPAPVSADTSESPARTSRKRGGPPFDTSLDPSYPSWEAPPAFHITNHAPMRHPGPPHMARKPRAEMTAQERIGVEQVKKRVEKQKVLREAREGGAAWEWGWELLQGKGKQRAREDFEPTDLQAVEFFPFADYEELRFMEGVFAVCGGDTVEVLRVPHACSSSAPYERLASATSPSYPGGSATEESFTTLSWSINLNSQPPTPMLAVAGKGRQIEVFFLGRKRTGEWVLHHDRTIPGHGGAITSVHFHPTHPHLLVSSSLDYTLRFHDACAKGGSNREAYETVLRQVGSKKSFALREGLLLRRRRVKGELLAMAGVGEDGHGKGVVSCDFHPTLPLLVSAGMDAGIRIWHLPSALLAQTPSLSSPRPSTPPPLPREPLLLPSPLFSSRAIHPGQWPTSVRFLGTRSVTLATSAPVTHAEARFQPRKCVRVWQPTELDLPSPPSRSASSSFAAPSSAAVDWREKHPATGNVPTPARTGAKARPSGVYRVLKEIVLEGQDCIFDIFGLYLPRAPTGGEDVGVPDPLLVVPATTSALGGEGLYFFRPFAVANPSLPVAQKSGGAGNHRSGSNGSRGGTPAGGGGGTPLSRSGSLPSGVPSKLSHQLGALDLSGPPPTGHGTSNSQSLLPRARRAAAEALAFPPDRDRLMHDFHPRLFPSSISPVPLRPEDGEAMDADSEKERRDPENAEGRWDRAWHLRGVAVDPGGARAVVGVGTGGVTVWRRMTKG